MISRGSVRRAAMGALAVGLVAGLFDSIAAPAHADEDRLPPRVASAAPALEPAVPTPRPFPPRGSVVRRGAERSEGTGSWWLGTAGIALALAIGGGISLATRVGWRSTQVNTV